MSIPALLSHLHLLLAALSALGLLVRAYVRIVRNQQLAHPMLSFGPHIIDTLLVFSGLGLWMLLGYSLLSWLGLKLLLVLAYPILAVLAFSRRDSQPTLSLTLLGASVLAFAIIAVLAVYKPL